MGISRDERIAAELRGETPRHRSDVTILTFKEWQALYLYSQGWSARQLASVLAIPLEAYKGRIRAGREKLVALGHNVSSVVLLRRLVEKGVIPHAYRR